MTAASRRFVITDDLIRTYSRRGNFHSDPARAEEAGMPGLVAQGTQVCAPVIGALLDAWGDDFLAHGELDLRFVGMVLGGQEVQAAVEVDGTRGVASFTVVNVTTARTAAIGDARRRAQLPNQSRSGPVGENHITSSPPSPL